MKLRLPRWTSWGPLDWKGKYESCVGIIENMLGWDLTDFGNGDFQSQGLILFRFRNFRSVLTEFAGSYQPEAA